MIDGSRLRRKLARLLLLALAVGAYGATASAQGVLPDTGTRVRVFFNQGRDYYIGYLLPSSADSIFLEGPRGDTMTVARTNVARLQVGSDSSRGTSMAIGMGVGLVTGAAAGFGLGELLSGGGDAMVGGNAFGALLLGSIGTVAGGVVGYSAGRHWRDVSITPTVGARGAGARIALRF